MAAKVEIILPKRKHDGPHIGFGTRILLNGQSVPECRVVDIRVSARDPDIVTLEIVPSELIIRYAEE